jgi:hypothetical protein
MTRKVLEQGGKGEAAGAEVHIEAQKATKKVRGVGNETSGMGGRLHDVWQANESASQHLFVAASPVH